MYPLCNFLLSFLFSWFDARRLRGRQAARKHDANLPTSAFSGRTLQGESGRPPEISRWTSDTKLGESLRNQRSALLNDDAWPCGADVARTTSATGLLLVVADLRTVPLRLADRLIVDDSRRSGDLHTTLHNNATGAKSRDVRTTANLRTTSESMLQLRQLANA